MTTRNPRAAKRRRRPRTVAELALTVAIGLTLLVSYVWFGGVTSGARAATHLGLAVAALACLVMATEYVRTAGTAVRLAVGGGLLIGAAATGFLPVPGFLQGVVAPGFALRGSTHTVSTLDPAATLTTISGILLATGMAFSVAVWAGRRRARVYVWYLIASVTAGSLLLAGGMVLAGQRTWLFTTIDTGPPFFAPFINPNHFGAMLVLLFPFAFGRAVTRREGELPSWLGALLAFGILGLAAWAASTGPLLVMALQAIVLLRRERQLPLWTLGVVFVLGLGGLVVWDVLFSSGDRASLHGRLPIWWNSLRMGADHWLLGTGAGTYGDALPPYRTDDTFESWPHAHNDWLEWVTDTGLIGVVALLAALVVNRPGPSRRGAGGRYAMIGVLGVSLHALIDFPFHIPFLAMAAASLFAFQLAIYHRRPKVPILVYRVAAGALALGHLGGFVWELRNVQVDRARDELAVTTRGTERYAKALASLETWSPSAPEVGIHEAVEHIRAGRTDEGLRIAQAIADAYAYDANVLAAVAGVHRLAGDPQRGLTYAELAVERAPSDWRVWRVRARLLEAAEPHRAGEGWADAFAAGDGRALKEGWRALPLGVFWVQAVEGMPVARQHRVAGFLFRRGDKPAALLAYQNAHRLDPMTLSVEYASLLVELEPELAGPYLESAVRIQPNHRGYRELHARLLEEGERWEQAAASWKKLASDDQDARFHYTFCLEKAAGPDVALLELERAKARGELFSPDTLFLKAELHRRQGQASACRSTITRFGLLDRRKTRKRAQALFETCGDQD